MMRLHKIFFIAFVVAGFCAPAFANDINNDPQFDETFHKANELFMDSRFDDGIALFTEFEKNHPGNPAISFFTANGYWWKIFRAYIYDKEAKTTPFDDQFEHYLQETIDRCDDLLDRDKKNLQALFYLGNAYSLKSRVKGLRGSYFSAGRDAAKGKRYLEEVLKINPKQYDTYYNLGVYNYLAGTLPGYAKVLKIFLFLPGGSKQEGLNLLKTASEKSVYFGYEAQLILARFYADHEERPNEGLKIIQNFHKNYPDNAWFHYWLGTLYSDELNDYDNAERIYKEILSKYKQGHANYSVEVMNQSWLKLARVYARQYEPEKGINELKTLIATKSKEPIWIIPRAFLELGNLYDQIGMHKEALLSYKQVLSYRDYRDFHEQASKLINQDYNQGQADIYRLNLEGRRLASAGRYEEAEASFEKVLKQYPNNVQTLYAIAETYYLKGSYDDSSKLLNQILSRRPKEPKWLVPGVYVRLGQVYEARKQADQARLSYEKALETETIGSEDRNLAKRALRQIAHNKNS